MPINVHITHYDEVKAFRELYRHEANCQIIHDSALQRKIAIPYIIEIDGQIAGYGGVWNKYYKGRVMEFHVLPHARRIALPILRKLLSVTRATHIEAQTNIPFMLEMLHECAKSVTAENTLFQDAYVTQLACPNGVFRKMKPTDKGPDGDWGIEVDGTIVAAGGFLTHYNPPYGDIYMNVVETERQKGYGSYLIQELKRVCYQAGKKPAARCNPDNEASRRTLEKAGLLPCGQLLVGKVRG